MALKPVTALQTGIRKDLDGRAALKPATPRTRPPKRRAPIQRDLAGGR